MQKDEKLKQDEIRLHKGLSKKYVNIREKSPYYIFFNSHWIHAYRALLPKRKWGRVLDLGCGTVEFYELITRDLGAQYTGTDLSPDMIEAGRKKYPGIDLQVADAEALPFKDGTFDLIITRGLIHHLPNPNKGMQEACRVLKKGGYLIASEPHSNLLIYTIRLIFYKLSSHFSDSHKSFFKKEYEDLFEKNGFSIDKKRFIGITAFPFALPDILPLYKVIPLSFFKLLVHLDLLLEKIPVIQSFAWHMIISARKDD
jgi:SAM-dependent methyltransferase